MKKIVISTLLLSLLGGCASTDEGKKVATVEDGHAAQTTTAQTNSSTQAMTNSTVDSTKINPLNDPNSVLSKRSVYFDYDSAAVKDESKFLVQAHAKYLTDHKQTKVTIQGNTDDRGSREYNLALGQRRADNVRKAMTVLGASDNQIEAVSLGEEKPRAMGQDESAYAENRRADVVYQGE